MSNDSTGDAPKSPDDVFVTTRWSVVLSAGRQSSQTSQRALAELCETYWYPLYVYVRRRTKRREDAEDLVQSFFERFLEKNYLEGLSAQRGKFRAYLLACLKHFLSNEWAKAGRQKRGGGFTHFSLDWNDADTRYQHEPSDEDSPDKAFDREWALALLERVIGQLRDQCIATGKLDLFEQARGYLMVGEEAIPFAEAGRKLGLEEGTVRVAVHRLRKRYRHFLREEIAQTLDDPSLVSDELNALQAALSS